MGNSDDVSRPRSRILVADGQWLIAAAVAELIQEFGYDAVGPLTTSAEALSDLEGGLGAAVVDTTLLDGSPVRLIQALQDRGIPVVLTTTLPERIPLECAGLPYLEKPYRPRALQALLSRLVREASQPLYRPPAHGQTGGALPED